MAAYVLDASFDTPATELSLVKLRLRRASLRFTQRDLVYRCESMLQIIRTPASCPENLGGSGAGPRRCWTRGIEKFKIFDRSC